MMNKNEEIKALYNSLTNKGEFIWTLARECNRSAFTVRNHWFNPVATVPIEWQETALKILKTYQK